MTLLAAMAAVDLIAQYSVAATDLPGLLGISRCVIRFLQVRLTAALCVHPILTYLLEAPQQAWEQVPKGSCSTPTLWPYQQLTRRPTLPMPRFVKHFPHIPFATQCPQCASVRSTQVTRVFVQSVVGIDPELSRGELAVSLLRPVAVLCALHLYRFGFAGPPFPSLLLQLTYLMARMSFAPAAGRPDRLEVVCRHT